jgi:hypothetical protein
VPRVYPPRRARAWPRRAHRSSTERGSALQRPRAVATSVSARANHPLEPESFVDDRFKTRLLPKMHQHPQRPGAVEVRQQLEMVASVGRLGSSLLPKAVVKASDELRRRFELPARPWEAWRGLIDRISAASTRPTRPRGGPAGKRAPLRSTAGFRPPLREGGDVKSMARRAFTARAL